MKGLDFAGWIVKNATRISRRSMTMGGVKWNVGRGNILLRSMAKKSLEIQMKGFNGGCHEQSFYSRFRT